MKKLTNKLYNWASIIDENTKEQAERTSKMPFVVPHLALMPDAHMGAGATVGSVIPTIGAIMPAAVGVDIGCGMIAVKTQFTTKDIEGKDLAALRHSIERSIPLSAGSFNSKLTESVKPRASELEKMAGDRKPFYDKLTRTHWSLQLGTLGSGNHFIEVTVDEEDTIWLFLHSGSRGIGNAIATHHIKIAQAYVKKNYIKLEDDDLAYLVEGTPEFNEYITDLIWAQHFALLNREEMMDRVVKDFMYFTGVQIKEKERINCHHNFTQKEHHMGRDVWLSRKGAIQANKGQKGLIPGSMGTASYVVEGKGFAPSYNSAPHGAGRVWARRAAQRHFTIEDMDKAMVGIEYKRSEAFLDEIPAAYKDIDVVMEDAKDLIEIKHTFHQIVNVKGL
ncbi:MAG TPA: RtcB family protein [Candidatus Saccharimonadales bacterium]|nr:RtcB family protein [Candidatus Saccharimonadales bacterium]